MTTNDEYVPSEVEMRRAYRLTRMLDHHADVTAAFDRFLARVRQAAMAEALIDAAEDLFYDGDSDRPMYGHRELYDRAARIEKGNSNE